MKRYIVIFTMFISIFFVKTANADAFNFTDVWPGSYCFESVRWAAENGISNGTGNNSFSPNQVCSQAQFLLFLWRANGAPEPSTANPFSNNIIATYYKPAVWAYENGMITAGIFDASLDCNLETLLSCLWQVQGRPGHDAYSWVVENGLNRNTGINTFAANYPCTRGQVMVFLYNINNLYSADSISISDNENQNSRDKDYGDRYYNEKNRYDYDYDDYDDYETKDLNISISKSAASSVVGSAYEVNFQLAAHASGGSGDYSYMFEIIQNGKVENATDWSENNAIRTKLSGTGSCEIMVYVRDSDGNTASKLVDLLENSSHYSGISAGSPSGSAASSIISPSSGSAAGIVISSGWSGR